MRKWQRWWWVILSSAILLLFYPCALLNKKKEIVRLMLKIREKEQERWAVLSEREELQLQVDSQSDPSWMEMLLIRDLGMVPDGWLKVHFIQQTR